MMKPIAFFLLVLTSCQTVKNLPDKIYGEPHRPQIHFSPREHWMNDPNGMVYHQGIYHLFFQYYPDSTVWGPMHWGHATSRDLVNWEEQPVALFPDSLGYIFSGSAVADSNNTTGFGTNGKFPLVAIFTHHDPQGEKAGTGNYQNQSLAYSIDDGETWTKYPGNPVLQNPGIKDFRDPKVRWHSESKKWIMTLATKDRITFYSSPDLKQWERLSEFGAGIGAHGGVWECPDLFPLDYRGQKIWVLLVSINPGGPNGGSATQYFTGNFDGITFTPFQTDIRWIDYGPDNYAGVTWANTGDRTIFMGWMSNWLYANVVPTEKWRSAMTAPRDLHIQKSGDKFLVASALSPEMRILDSKTQTWEQLNAPDFRLDHLENPSRIEMSGDTIADFEIFLFNEEGEQLKIGYSEEKNNYYIDRTSAGEKNFHKDFGDIHEAPRLTGNKDWNLTLLIDHASVELFADGGLSVMTEIYFPRSLLQSFRMEAPKGLRLRKVQYTPLKSIWNANRVDDATPADNATKD